MEKTDGDVGRYDAVQSYISVAIFRILNFYVINLRIVKEFPVMSTIFFTNVTFEASRGSGLVDF